MINKLKELKELKQNWNEHNAPPIPLSTLINAEKTINLIKDVNVQIFPTNDGDVKFEYDLNGIYVELVIEPNKFTIAKGDCKTEQTFIFLETAVAEFIKIISSPQKSNRLDGLNECFELIQNICVEKDLRFGQLLEIIKHKLDIDDLFYVDNNSILDELKHFQTTKH